MDKKYFLFDLDGTLTDPKVGITKGLDIALKKVGIITEDIEELTMFIGPSLRKSFKNHYNLDDETVVIAIEEYRKYYSTIGIFENAPYEGIDIMLSDLKKQGKKILLATAKPTVYAKQVLEHFDIYKYFDFIGGSELDGTRSEKKDVITYVIEECNITDIENAIMIGDRMHDITGARLNNMESIGVTYGYGDREELELAKANIIVDTVEELRNTIL